MAEFANAIAGNPWYILITAVVTIAGFVALVFAVLSAVWRIFYRKLPAPTSGQRQAGQAESSRPIKLKLQHRLKPSKHPLKGKRVVATGTIWNLEYRDKDVPTMELHAFPHNIDVVVACAFAKEYATDLHALDHLRLVSVVGTAVDSLEIADSGRGHGCRLRLTNCEVERASFLTWLRFEWNLLRPWWLS